LVALAQEGRCQVAVGGHCSAILAMRILLCMSGHLQTPSTI
jgi:hypothetical protein